MEIWKDIPHYEGIYEVSNFGKVRTCKEKITFTKYHGERHWKQRILFQKKAFRKNKTKFDFYVDLWKDGKHKNLKVARCVASAFIEDNLFNKNMTINHIDNDSSNNTPNNLEWCSRKDNIKKGFETGAYKKCTKSILLTDKKTNASKKFRSMATASQYMGYSKSYVSSMILCNIYENKNYTWKLEI